MANVSEEFGVSVGLLSQKTDNETLKCFNPKLSLMREAALCTVWGESRSSGHTLQCLDAIAATGIVSLQWKKHLGTAVHVIAADTNTDNIKFTCERNNIASSDWKFNDHVTGELPMEQKEDEIHVCRDKANVVLQKEAFDFVYLQPNGTVAVYLDSLFTNIRHDGVVCIVSPDISSQCFRSPNLILQQYQAYVMKTDYVREMAMRVIIGNIANSAARHSRGIEVLYTLCHADTFLVAVRVLRGSRPATTSATHVRMVLHCRLCEERVVYPDMHAPIDSPYQLLSCDCHSTMPGKTAVNLGPMWCGNIFSVPYLTRTLLPLVREKFPNGKLLPLLESVLSEARCDSEQSAANQKQDSKQNKVIVSELTNQNEELLTDRNTTNLEQNNGRDSKLASDKQEAADGNTSANSTESLPSCDSGEPMKKRLKINDSEMSNQKSESGTTSEPIRMDDGNNSATEEGNKISEDITYEDTPLFYHNLHRKKLKGIVLPKSNKLVSLLQKAGYRASRTHFDANAIRTSATFRQILQVIEGE